MTKTEALKQARSTLTLVWVQTTELADLAILRSTLAVIDAALAELDTPEGFHAVYVNEAFEDLMYWLERCERKGHLENCADLVEPWEKFEYRPFATAKPEPT